MVIGEVLDGVVDPFITGLLVFMHEERCPSIVRVTSSPVSLFA